MKNKTVKRPTSGMQINICSLTLQKQNGRCFYSVESLQYTCRVIPCFVQPMECGIRTISPSINLIDSEIESILFSINPSEDKSGAVLHSIYPSEYVAESILHSNDHSEYDAKEVISFITTKASEYKLVTNSVKRIDLCLRTIIPSIDAENNTSRKQLQIIIL